MARYIGVNMINSLTTEQVEWVLDNHINYSWRNLAREFEKKWSGSLEGIHHTLPDGSEYVGYAQADGIWLCEEAGVKCRE